MSPKTNSKTDLYSSRQETWGRPCLQVVNSALTKPEAMIHNEQAKNNYPHTGLLATYQLSRRLNMINLPTQLIWDELSRKIGYPTH